MNGDMYMQCHVKNSLAQVKDQYNRSKFYMKLGEKISTNDTCNHALGNLPNDPILCKLSLKGKMCIILMMVRHV